MKLRIALLAATAMALPLAAQAQPVTGLYIGAGAGINFQENMSFTELDSASHSGTFKARPGFVALGSAGWGFGNGLRLEAEFAWREQKYQGASGFSAHSTQLWAFGGRMSTLSAMANVLYDFNGISPWFVPYVGAGVGFGWRNANNMHGFHSGDHTSGSDGNLAYQGIAGAAFPLPAVPGLSITAEYRFHGVLSTRYNYDDPNDLKLGRAHSHSLLLGARYEFNKAPMAMVQQQTAAVVPPGRSFLVFFDWDRFNLTDRARAVIRDAAATSKSVQHTRLEVNGYADTSGSANYNMPLSMKRAQTVAAELVRNGVARNEIVIKAFGESVLLVPTGDGVREPQNRRVEIIIR